MVAYKLQVNNTISHDATRELIYIPTAIADVCFIFDHYQLKIYKYNSPILLDKFLTYINKRVLQIKYRIDGYITKDYRGFLNYVSVRHIEIMFVLECTAYYAPYKDSVKIRLAIYNIGRRVLPSAQRLLNNCIIAKIGLHDYRSNQNTLISKLLPMPTTISTVNLKNLKKQHSKSYFRSKIKNIIDKFLTYLNWKKNLMELSAYIFSLNNINQDNADYYKKNESFYYYCVLLILGAIVVE